MKSRLFIHTSSTYCSNVVTEWRRTMWRCFQTSCTTSYILSVVNYYNTFIAVHARFSFAHLSIRYQVNIRRSQSYEYIIFIMARGNSVFRPFLPQGAKHPGLLAETYWVILEDVHGEDTHDQGCRRRQCGGSWKGLSKQTHPHAEENNGITSHFMDIMDLDFIASECMSSYSFTPSSGKFKFYS